MGEEPQQAGCKALVDQAVKQGAAIQIEEYKGMPHVFPLLPVLDQVPQVQRCLNAWGEFCRICVTEPDLLKSRRTVIIYDTSEETELQFNNLLGVDFNEANCACVAL